MTEIKTEHENENKNEKCKTNNRTPSSRSESKTQLASLRFLKFQNKEQPGRIDRSKGNRSRWKKKLKPEEKRR